MTHTLMGLWHRTKRRIGRTGVVTAGLLSCAAALVAWTTQLDRQSDTLRRRLQVVATSPKTTAQVKAQPIPIAQQIGEFTAAFPLLSQSSADLNEVFQSAKRHNIQLSRGDYQFKDDANAALLVLTATFPLSAGYGQTKGFAADVLGALPNVSMDELSMSRSSAGDTALESSVRFSFVYRRH